jgi:hypothetical protein
MTLLGTRRISRSVVGQPRHTRATAKARLPGDVAQQFGRPFDWIDRGEASGAHRRLGCPAGIAGETPRKRDPPGRSAVQSDHVQKPVMSTRPGVSRQRATRHFVNGRHNGKYPRLLPFPLLVKDGNPLLTLNEIYLINIEVTAGRKKAPLVTTCLIL